LDWHLLEHFKSSCLGLFFPVLEQVAALKATTTRRHNSPRRKPIVQVGLKNPDSLLHRQSYAFEAFLLFTVTTLESEDRRSSPLRCSAPPLPVQRPKNGQTPEPPRARLPIPEAPSAAWFFLTALPFLLVRLLVRLAFYCLMIAQKERQTKVLVGFNPMKCWEWVWEWKWQWPDRLSHARAFHTRGTHLRWPGLCAAED